MSPSRARPWVALVLGVAGCATQGDLAQQQRRFDTLLGAQSRSIEQVAREVQRLRADLAAHTPRRTAGRQPIPQAAASRPAPEAAAVPAPSPAEMARAAALEDRVRQLEERRAAARPIGMTPAAPGMSREDPSATERTIMALAARQASAAAPRRAGAQGTAPSPSAPQRVAALSSPPGTTLPSPAATAVRVDASWKREVAQDRAVASVSDGGQRAVYLRALDRLSRGECAHALSSLGPLLSETTPSPLVDNALYWQARCSALEGDTDRAIASLRTLAGRYPTSDKAPAALWEEGQLLLQVGDNPGARAALATLIREYPATAEATDARRVLAELAHRDGAERP